mgnify:CR=1 FL=1
MSTKTLLIVVFGFIIVTIGLAFVFSAGQKPSPVAASFSAQDADRPKVETTQTFFDLGEMKVSDVKQADFFVKNVGTRPLQILNINSSCNCTFGQVIYKDLTTKEYGMHAQSGYVTEIAPGDTATVRVTYKPSIMPIYGLVEREVYITTNDPDRQKLIFSVKAKVK